MGAFDLFGTVASGWLSDKYDNRYFRSAFITHYAGCPCSICRSPWEQTWSRFPCSQLFTASTGLPRCRPPSRLTTDRFGTTIGPLVSGWMFVAHQLGASIAAYGAGLTRTLDGTYAPAFMLSGLLCIVAGLAFLAIDGKRKNDSGKTVSWPGPRLKIGDIKNTVSHASSSGWLSTLSPRVEYRFPLRLQTLREDGSQHCEA